MGKELYFKPALIGGAIMGLLTSLPVCCMGAVPWALIGGFLSLYLLKESIPDLTPAVGATAGFLSGICGTVMFCLVFIPYALVSGGPIVPEAIRRKVGESVATSTAASDLFTSSGTSGLLAPIILTFLLFALFATLGGLLAALAFRPRKD
jgi:hypothetical protein